MPLAVGAAATLHMALAIGGLGPIEWVVRLVLPLVVSGVAAGNMWGTVLIAVAFLSLEVFLIAWAAGHAHRAWRQWPSDVVISDRGVTVEGGRYDGRHWSWDELDRDKTGMTGDRLRLYDLQGDHWDLARAYFGEERHSLEVLANTLRRIQPATTAPAAEDETTPFSCEDCGAPVTPQDESHAKCRHCGTRKAVPEELRDRIRAAREGRAVTPALESAVRKLLQQPGTKAARRYLTLGGVLMLGAWVVTYGLWHLQKVEAGVMYLGTMASIWQLPFLVIPGVGLLVRATMIDRFAMGRLTLGHAARVGPDGITVCHGCGGGLPDASAHVIVRCIFCSVDNVLGLDLRDRVRHDKQDYESLARTLEARRTARWAWGVGGVILGFGSLYLAGGAFERGRVRPTFTRVVGDRAESGREIADTSFDVRDPATTRDNKHLLVVAHRDGESPFVGYVDLAARELTPEPVWQAPGLRDPTWIDAHRFLVVADDPDGGASLHATSRQGGPGRMLYRAEDLEGPSVAPDGRRAIVAAKRGGVWQLVVVDIDSGSATETHVHGRTPAWHPLRDVVVHIRLSDGVSKLMLMRLDEAPRTSRELLKFDRFSYRDPAWSPCGGWLVYATNAWGGGYRNDAEPNNGFNLVIATFDTELASVPEPVVYEITEGSATTSRPSWGFGGIWWESDQFDRPVVWETRTMAEIGAELYANPDCPHAFSAE